MVAAVVGVPELLIILAILLVLFGAKRLPDLARSLGRSVKELQDGLEEGASDDGDDADASDDSQEAKATEDPSPTS